MEDSRERERERELGREDEVKGDKRRGGQLRNEQMRVKGKWIY